MNGKSAGQWESTVLTHGPDAGRIGWRPAGRDSRWQTNVLFHPERLAPGPDTADMAPGRARLPHHAGPHGDPDGGSSGDTGPPSQPRPPGGTDPSGKAGPRYENPDGPNPTIVIFHRPPPLIPEIAPANPPSGAEQRLARILAQAQAA